MVLCSGCPRSYHYQCLDKGFKARSRGTINFNCPQHQCFDCEKKTADAGGMIFRCRWCERGYCDDCLDWDKTELIGENLQEFELLGFPTVTQAFYISCPSCADYQSENSCAREFYETMALQYDAQHAEAIEEQALVAAAAEVAKKPMLPPSRAESLTEQPHWTVLASQLRNSERQTIRRPPVHESERLHQKQSWLLLPSAEERPSVEAHINPRTSKS